MSDAPASKLVSYPPNAPSPPRVSQRGGRLKQTVKEWKLSATQGSSTESQSFRLLRDQHGAGRGLALCATILELTTLYPVCDSPWAAQQRGQLCWGSVKWIPKLFPMTS